MQPEPYDSGNPEQVKAKKSKAKVREERDRKDTLDFMSTPGNRRIYWWLLSEAKVEHVSYQWGISHADMAFREGERNFANLLRQRVMSACPDLHFQAMKEANEEEKTNE